MQRRFFISGLGISCVAGCASGAGSLVSPRNALSSSRQATPDQVCGVCQTPPPYETKKRTIDSNSIARTKLNPNSGGVKMANQLGTYLPACDAVGSVCALTYQGNSTFFNSSKGPTWTISTSHPLFTGATSFQIGNTKFWLSNSNTARFSDPTYGSGASWVTTAVQPSGYLKVTSSSVYSGFPANKIMVAEGYSPLNNWLDEENHPPLTCEQQAAYLNAIGMLLTVASTVAGLGALGALSADMKAVIQVLGGAAVLGEISTWIGGMPCPPPSDPANPTAGDLITWAGPSPQLVAGTPDDGEGDGDDGSNQLDFTD